MRVRCPRCATIRADPPGRFACSGCGRQLAWHVPQRWLPEQLPLFGLPGVADPMPLPFASATASAPRDDPAAPTSSALESLRDAITLVTALLPAESDGGDLVPALLADQDPERLLSLTSATAWLASVLVAQLDDVQEGAGTDWLRALALQLAE